MMFSNPYYHFPYSPRYSRYGYHYPSYSPPSACVKEETKPEPPKRQSSRVMANRTQERGKTKIVEDVKQTLPKEDRGKANQEEDPIFEIFGIKLYFDDILIVCLIFFLYQEGVQDQSLFISLVLLLLS